MKPKIELPEELKTSIGLETKEELVKVRQKKDKLFIGIPKERMFQEKRIALTPESVEILVANGHRVMMETRAGEHAHWGDSQFSEAGAEIVKDQQEVFKANIILKVAPPAVEEILLFHPHQIV